jgi:hypothetical protein
VPKQGEIVIAVFTGGYGFLKFPDMCQFGRYLPKFLTVDTYSELRILLRSE